MIRYLLYALVSLRSGEGRGQRADKACKVGRTVWTRTGQGLRNMTCVMAYGKRLRLDYPRLGLFIFYFS